MGADNPMLQVENTGQRSLMTMTSLCSFIKKYDKSLRNDILKLWKYDKPH